MINISSIKRWQEKGLLRQTATILVENGFETEEQIREAGTQGLLRLSGFGRKKLNEIKDNFPGLLDSTLIVSYSEDIGIDQDRWIVEVYNKYGAGRILKTGIDRTFGVRTLSAVGGIFRM